MLSQGPEFLHTRIDRSGFLAWIFGASRLLKAIVWFCSYSCLLRLVADESSFGFRWPPAGFMPVAWT